MTIRTTYTAPGGEAPYEDGIGPDGLVRYKWRGTEPRHADNRALREAMRQQRPLAYFYGAARGVYHPFYPVYLVAEDRERHERPDRDGLEWRYEARRPVTGPLRTDHVFSGSTSVRMLATSTQM